MSDYCERCSADLIHGGCSHSYCDDCLPACDDCEDAYADARAELDRLYALENAHVA